MRYLRIIVVAIFVMTLVAFGTSNVLLNYNVDRDGPVITAESDECELSSGDGEDVLLQGMTAEDRQDGDLTEKIFIGEHSPFTEKGSCKVEYVVFDSSNNVGTYTRKVTYKDYTSPEFQLSKPLIYSVGESVTVLDRLTVQDCIEGDITDKIKIVSSDVDNHKAGVYRIGVEATNGFGDTVAVNLPVNIVQTAAEVTSFQVSECIVTINKNESFDPGQYVTKPILADGTEGVVQMDSDVDVSKAGTYQVIYSYTSESGVQESTSLIVVVRE